MDILGLTHLENILYRKDNLDDRIATLYRWMKEDKLNFPEFKKLLASCNEAQLKIDLKRHNLSL
jgi:hypothetical protein